MPVTEGFHEVWVSAARHDTIHPALATTNPTGLVYWFEANYLRGESGWGKGMRFKGAKDWSMFINHTPGARD